MHTRVCSLHVLCATRTRTRTHLRAWASPGLRPAGQCPWVVSGGLRTYAPPPWVSGSDVAWPLGPLLWPLSVPAWGGLRVAPPHSLSPFRHPPGLSDRWVPTCLQEAFPSSTHGHPAWMPHPHPPRSPGQRGVGKVPLRAFDPASSPSPSRSAPSGAWLYSRGVLWRPPVAAVSQPHLVSWGRPRDGPGGARCPLRPGRLFRRLGRHDVGEQGA